VVRRGWGQGGEMTQASYAHMNNKTIKILKKNIAWKGQKWGILASWIFSVLYIFSLN
jgi:hypothetical protein